jgi:RHS repeat-associated protein
VSGTPAQLVEVYYSADGEDISWTFDARGNRLTETKYEGGASTGNITLSYYDNSDLIKTRGSWQFNYDKNGNMLSRGTDGTWNGSSYDWAADSGELWEYEYDLSNRLISVKKSAAGTDGLKAIASYAYDIRGLRVESVKDSGVTYYQYGLKGELLWSDDGSTQEKYVYANAKIWAEVRTTGGENATYYHHVDHLGTTETITDAAGTVIWDASYEAYGKLVHENGTVSFKASFTGKQVDADTGLYYFNARWYDAELGRFVTEDPARDGSNWYEYCGNNPLKYTDPDGRENGMPSYVEDIMKTQKINARVRDGSMSELPIEGPCYMRTLQGVAESYTGKNLSQSDIKSAITNLINNGNLEENSFLVNDGPAVIKDALGRLGVDSNDITVKISRPGDKSYNDTKESATASLRNVGRADQPDATSLGHWQEGDKNGEFVFDPISGASEGGRKNFSDNTRFIIIKPKEEN